MKKQGAFLLLALTAALLVAGCGSDKNKIGSTVKGTRVAVLESGKTIEADKELDGQKPEVSDTTANAEWPQAGYETAHILPNAEIGQKPQQVWSSSMGEGSDSDFKLLARPVVAGGHVYTMDAQGLVSSFDAKTGNEDWEFDTTPKDRDDNAIGGGVGVDGDTVYATTGFGEVLALKTSDGTVRWRKMLLKPMRAAPTIADNRVYAVSIDNELHALDARTGEDLWHHNGIAESATLMGASNPAVVGDSVVIAYSSGEIYNLRAENGRVSWNYNLTTPTQVGALPAIADIRGLPVIAHGLVFAVSHSGRTAVIDQRSGDRGWEIDIGGINTPVVAGDAVYILTNDGQLVAVQGKSGRIMWVRDLQHFEDPKDKTSDPVFWTGPVMGDSKLWLTNTLGELVSFSAKDGEQVDLIDLDDGPIFIPPVIASRTIYVVTDGGDLIALR